MTPEPFRRLIWKMICLSKEIWLCHLIICLFLFSCSSAPKEKEQTSPIRKTNELRRYETASFSFDYNKGQTIIPKIADSSDEIWLDILDSDLDATIYCSYLTIDQESLYKTLEDSYRLAYSHISVSEGISQQLVLNDSLKTYATIYDIEGQVATPIQFFVTDSTSHFLRGSLYYNKAVKNDSVASATKLLRDDILTLINTLRWKDK